MSDGEKLAYTALGIPKTATDDEVEAGLDQVDLFNVEVPPAPLRLVPNVEPPTPPDEGPAVDVADVLALSTRYASLPEAAKKWTGRLVAEGSRVWSFRIKDKPTVRRYEITRGILALAELFYSKEEQ